MYVQAMLLRPFLFAFALAGVATAGCGGSHQVAEGPATEPPVGMQSAALSAAGSSVTVQQAIRNGCYSAAQVRAIFDAATFTSGSVTKQKIDSYFYQGSFPDQGTTKARVNAVTWVYRGYGEKNTEDLHVRKLLAGVLYSKAQNRVDKNRMDWSAQGPELLPGDFTARNPAVLAMRLLATKTSDTPASQFNSVALDYNIASGFGTVVYAFQVRPDSEVLGLQGCRLGKGEDQLQIAGGTSISNLHRRVRGSDWMKYNQATGGWAPITGLFPPN